MNTLEKYDFNRYFLTHFTNKDVRKYIYALLELNVSLGLIKQKTSDKPQALVRLQFWQNELQKYYDNQTIDAFQSSPIKTLLDFDKSFVSPMQGLITTYSKDFYGIKDMSEFNNYCCNIGGNIFYIWAKIINNNAKDETLTWAKNLGSLWTELSIIQGFLLHAYNGLLLLPKELLWQHNILFTDNWRPKEKDKQNLKIVMQQLLNDCQTKADKLKQDYDKSWRLKSLNKAIHLQLAIIKHLQNLDYNCFHNKWHVTPKLAYVKAGLFS